MATENKIKELTKQIEELSFAVEHLTHALKGELGDHLTDAIIYLAHQMELAKKNTEA